MTVLLALAVAAVTAASFGGYCVGVRRGRDAGWVEHYFHEVRQDRARRNRLGQFKSKGDAQ